MAYLAFLSLSLTFSLRMKHLTDQNWWQSDEAVAKEVLRQGRILYWLLGASVQKSRRFHQPNFPFSSEIHGTAWEIVPSSRWFENGYAKLSRRLARYHRTIALFQSPLSERSVTVSVSRALSSSHSCRLAATSDLQHHFWLSAFRVPHGGFGLTTCAPSPLGWLSHPPWWIVTSTTPIGTPFP
jgi:hypothetical protein